MSSIKERITKKCHSDPRVTIDTIHTNIIGDLNEEDKTEYYLENGLLLDQYYSKSSENKTVKTKDITIETENAKYDQKLDLLKTIGITIIKIEK